MARAGHEADAQAFDVVVGVVERVDFQLAAIARAGVHLADGQRLAQDVQQFVLDAAHLGQHGVVLTCGAGSVAMPTRAIWRRMCHITDRAPNS
jgi:hypothetical protein